MGPLQGIKVIEMAGLGPAPMGAMMLADMGATVVRVSRPGKAGLEMPDPVSGRGKQSVVLDVKSEAGLEALLVLIESADVLIDPYRPGVCEKLGFGPEVCATRNPKLIFARMTGWGQTGPLANAAGHDLNYIAITGALHAIGRRDQKPAVPLNLIGDMGGGGMLLVNGILAALLETRSSGQGQVIDVAMVDGTAQLLWMQQGMASAGLWNTAQREANMLDGAAHFYDTYECACGGYVAIGSIEPQFYRELMRLAALPEAFTDQMNPAKWPELKAALAKVIGAKSRDEWCELMEGTDVCFAPVLTLEEAPDYAPNKARGMYIDVDGVTQHAPAPRFSRTPSEVVHGVHSKGADTRQALLDAGIDSASVDTLLATGGAVQA